MTIAAAVIGSSSCCRKVLVQRLRVPRGTPVRFESSVYVRPSRTPNAMHSRIFSRRDFRSMPTSSQAPAAAPDGLPRTVTAALEDAITSVIHQGARRLLAAAFESEVAAYLEEIQHQAPADAIHGVPFKYGIKQDAKA